MDVLKKSAHLLEVLSFWGAFVRLKWSEQPIRAKFPKVTNAHLMVIQMGNDIRNITT